MNSQKIIMVLASFLIGCSSIAFGTSGFLKVGKEGQLLLKGEERWNVSDLNKYNLSVHKDNSVYISEGVTGKGDDFDLNAKKKNKLWLKLEIRGGDLYRVSVFTEKIPFVYNENRFFVGEKLSNFISEPGKMNISYGEESGSYILLDSFPGISLYTECSFLKLKFSGASEKEHNQKYLSSKCFLDRVLITKVQNISFHNFK